MQTFLAVGPGRKPQRLSFPSEYEAAVSAQDLREAGMAIIPLYWSQTLQRYVSVPNNDT